MRRELPELLTVRQAAAYLQLHRLTVYAYVRRGRLPAIQLGRQVRIRRDDLDRLLVRVSTGSPSAGAQQAREVARVGGTHDHYAGHGGRGDEDGGERGDHRVLVALDVVEHGHRQRDVVGLHEEERGLHLVPGDDKGEEGADGQPRMATPKAIRGTMSGARKIARNTSRPVKR